MNKQEFLNELQARIRILEEAEQQDILAEYAQHIDLRTAAGLSEEEAIRDFGDLEELAAEILEAYHVDPARVDVPPARPLAGISSGLKRTAGCCRRWLSRLGSGLRNLGARITAGWAGLRQRLHSLHRTPASRPTDTADAGTATAPAPRLRRICTGAARGVRQLGRVLKALARLAWNLLLFLIALPFAAAGVLAILSIGVLAVLLVQGYPLAGPLLCCVGLALCCAALVGLGTTLILKRRSGSSTGGTIQVPAAATPSQSLVPAEKPCEEVSVHG